jgi:hypothetical protein
MAGGANDCWSKSLADNTRGDSPSTQDHSVGPYLLEAAEGTLGGLNVDLEIVCDCRCSSKFKFIIFKVLQ